MVLVSDLTGAALPYKERHDLNCAAVLAVAETTQPVAVHWQAAGCMVDPAQLGRAIDRAFNVRLVEITDSKGDALLDTLGLAALGLFDAQCLFRRLEYSDMASWMYDFGSRLFEDGSQVGEGEAVPGVDPAESWTCRHLHSFMPPNRLVVDVLPSRRHAGRPPG